MPEENDIPKQFPIVETASDETSQDVPVSSTETQSTNMEVHHHPDLHHNRKPWKEYFLEFIMIFLAVTMGFFAENIREHYSENTMAKELAESLYKEVYSDSVDLQKILGIRAQKVRSRMGVEFGIIAVNLRPLAMKFYDFRWNEKLTNDGSLNLLEALQQQPAPKRRGVILNIKNFDRLEAENAASYYRLALKATKILQLKNYTEINHKLLQTLREEYQIK